MAGYENIKDENSKRTPDERRELAKRAGKKSGETRRKKADLRNAMNLLLTTEIDHPEWTEMLEGMGLDSTLEYAVTASMIKEALYGNVSAYRAIKETVGQTNKSDVDLREQQADIELKQAKKQVITGENETDEALQKLDEILKGVYEYAAKQEAE